MNPYDYADFTNADDWPEPVIIEKQWPEPCGSGLHDVVAIRIDWCRTCGEHWDAR